VNREALWLTGYSTTAPLYSLTSSLNKIRNHAINASDSYAPYVTNIIHSDNQTMVLRKGSKGSQTITVLSNLGAQSEDVPNLQLRETDFDAGEELVEVLRCSTVTVGGDGVLSIEMNGGEPHVFYAADSLEGSGLCGHSGPVRSGGSGGSSNGTDGGSSESGSGNGAGVSAGGPSGTLVATTVGLMLLMVAAWA
jgi:alpha-amylase